MMWHSAAYSFHITAWGLWLAAAMLFALSTRNPFYLLLLIIVAIMVNRSQAAGGQESEIRNQETQNPGDLRATKMQNPQGLLLRTIIILALAVALLKGMSYHIGATILFTLPESIPVLGGPITAEGIAAAALDGLSILTVLAVFTAFSAGADYYAMLRGMPPFMRQVALVTSIAITFVPQTITRFSEIREAQALRGHRVRRITDLVPLVMPLLAGGMERSMNLAEAMEARGFSRATATGRKLPPILAQIGIAAGLGLTLVGSTMFAFAPAMPWLAWLLVALGLVLFCVTLWAVGKTMKKSRYRRAHWRAADTPLTILSLGVLAIIITFKLLAPSLLTYNPFLRISMPTFDMMVALTIAALLSPAIIMRIQSVKRES